MAGSIKNLYFPLRDNIEVDPKCVTNIIVDYFIRSNKEMSNLVAYFIEGDIEDIENRDTAFTAYFKLFDKELHILVAEGKIAVTDEKHELLVKFKEWEDYVGIDPDVVKQCMKIT